MIRIKFIGITPTQNISQIMVFKSLTVSDYMNRTIKEGIQNKLNTWLTSNGCKRGYFELII